MPKDARVSTLARLSHIEHLLHQSGAPGMTLEKLAELCEVSKRAIQRDLKLIESEDIFPLWHEHGHCGIVQKRYLPPIHFEPSQALNIFMAARLMASYAHRDDPDIRAIFTKLNCVMQPPLKEQINETISWMKTLPQNQKVVTTLNQLADAWTSGLRVVIRYQSAEATAPALRTIDPYFIQPAVPGHSAYVIGYCHERKDVRTFKIERISSVQITDEHFDIKEDFAADKYLSSAWGIMVGDEIIHVKMKVSKEMVRFMKEIVWHPSQNIVIQKDGSALMTVDVSHTAELMTWIMGWGDGLEVLEPASLRKEIQTKASSIVKIYAKK